ncbi:MAG: hypothetical protein B5M53_01360 [Candidatus Cloacimonas sp. 4484_209]|nr:MAG: hypothetical protein B5M53_01360 [Candidatus Cloacimonas sp. 4484_209]
MRVRNKEILRKIPSVDNILSRKELYPYLKRFPRKFVKDKSKKVLEDIRVAIINGKKKSFTFNSFLKNLDQIIQKESQNIKKVVNATGIILSTNLGRAPLPEGVVDVIKPIIMGYSNLEYDIKRGKRGKRDDHIVGLLKDLTGAEDALVVNNNAGAVLLCFDTFAKAKEVIVSRGQLVEIGGSFRLPDILKKKRCKTYRGWNNKPNIH